MKMSSYFKPVASPDKGEATAYYLFIYEIIRTAGVYRNGFKPRKTSRREL